MWLQEDTGYIGTVKFCADLIEKIDCVDKYNEDLIDPLKPVLPYILQVLHYTLLILCMLTCKWRELADTFYPILSVMMALLSFNLSER